MSPKDAVMQRVPNAEAKKREAGSWAVFIADKRVSGWKVTALAAWSDAWRRMTSDRN